MKVDPRNLDVFQDDEMDNPVFIKKEKTKKKKPGYDEFKKQDNRKFNKPKHKNYTDD